MHAKKPKKKSMSQGVRPSSHCASATKPVRKGRKISPSIAESGDFSFRVICIPRKNRGKREEVVEVLVAFGGNLGDRYGTFRNALALLAARFGGLDRVSRVYETAPMVLPGASAAGVPPYLNAALRFRSALPPIQI